MQLNQIYRLSKLTLVTGAVFLTSTTQVAASGFAVPEISVTGLALSNALVANASELGAIPYNPAAMAFHEGNSISVGAILVKPELSVTTGNGQFDSEADDIVALPSLSAHHSLTNTLSIGLAINTPFGLETEWLPETFVYSEANNPGGYPLGAQVPTKSELEVIDFSPALAFKLNDNASLSAGLDIYWVKNVVFNSAVNDGSTYPAVTLEGDGRGIGLQVSGLYVAGDWSFGISYHSKANIPLEGDIESPSGGTEASVDLELPSRLQLGVRHQTTSKLAIELDFTRTGWSSFDTLDIKETTYGMTALTSENKWDDANAYRLGATYDITGATQLRFGYTRDETPQQDKYFSARIPDADRDLFSIGVGHKLANDWTIDAGYMYVKFEERSISQPVWDTTTTEFNGTSAVNGDYESSVHLFGLGISKTFM